jgi:hypothetical protein
LVADTKGGATGATTADEKATGDGSATALGPWGQFFKDLPAPESKPITGATTVKDGAGYPGELVALSLLDDAVSSASTAVRRAGAERVLIVEDRALLDSDGAYLVFEAGLTAVTQRLELAKTALDSGPTSDQTMGQDRSSREMLLGAALGAVSAAPQIIGLAADLVGMFRTNYTMSSRTMTPDGTSLVTQVAKTLAALPGVTVMIDGLMTTDLESSALLKRLGDARDLRWQLAEESSDLRQRVAAAKAAIDTMVEDRTATRTTLLSVMGDGKDGAALDGRLKSIDEQISTMRAGSLRDTTLLDSVDAAIAAYGEFQTAALSAPEGGRPPLLAAMARECLHDETRPTHVLFVSVDSIGADVATPESQLARTGYVRYFGGLQVSYMLYDVAEGRVTAAEVERRLGSMRLALDGGEMVPGATSELR